MFAVNFILDGAHPVFGIFSFVLKVLFIFAAISKIKMVWSDLVKYTLGLRVFP